MVTQRKKSRLKAPSSNAGAWSGSRIERALESGASADLPKIESWVGAVELAELRELQRQAREGRKRGGPRVYLLPGIMGSSLGLPRKGGDPDVLWIDFVDTFRGRLVELGIKNGDSAATSVGIRGILWRYYAKLKYRLQAEGFDVVVHDFDWRLSIKKLGAQLAERIAADTSAEVFLVCHSMGGLVGRAALKAGASGKVRCLVMLGTPNHGSFAPILALRGTHPLVRIFALLNQKGSKADLVEKVFSTFPGLYEMIPEAAVAGVDYFDLGEWPSKGFRPDQNKLRECARIQDHLAAAGGQPAFHLIAGVNQPTKVAASIEGGEFVFSESREGDGTVPLAFARLENTATYYVEEEHGALPSHPEVAAAVVDIFRGGATERLPRTWSAPVRAASRMSESEIRSVWTERAQREGRRTGGPVRPEQVAEMLQPFLSPAKVRAAAPPPASASLDRVIVGRRRQRRLDIELAHGDITAVPSRCYVLGIYQGVDPMGAAGAVDAAMGNAIRHMLERRMFSGRAGEVFVMPASRRGLRSEFVLLAGMGPYDRFDGETQALVAENIIRTLVVTNIEEFSCVLLGDSSMRNRRDSLRNMLKGFFRGLDEADARGDFRRVTICERDDDRLAELRQALLAESASDLFDNVQVYFSESRFPPAAMPVFPARAAAAPPGAAHAYLLVRMLEDSAAVEMQATVMGASSRAAIGLTRKKVSAGDIKAALARVGADGFSFSDAQQLGRRLPEVLFQPELVAALEAERQAGSHVVLIHDAAASRIPWETLDINGWRPAVESGMSRRYLAADLSIARWQSSAQAENRLSLLLVVNPTQDLEGAEAEGERILKIIGANQAARVTTLRGAQATRTRLQEELASGRYDVVHYAGHAGFDPENGTRSGLICAGDEWLTGQDLSGLRVLPPLIFFNACESARVRKRSNGKGSHHRGGNVGVAESLMRGGVANFIGTYWPVGDSSALGFAEIFYAAITAGAMLGPALCQARRSLFESSEADWGDYIHFGDPAFRVRLPAAEPGR